MKKLIALLLALVMVMSLAACGGEKDNTPTNNADNPADTDTHTSAPTPDTGEEEGEGEVKSVITQYGSNPDYDVYTATIYCPEGAYFDEDEYAEFQTDGYINDFWVYDDVREYSAYATVYWSRDIYKEGDELPQGYGIVEQLYFEGEVAPETAVEYPKYDQKVTDLGFKWNDQDVKLIETTYTSAGDFDYSEAFVGVEYTHYFWKVKDGGEVEDGITAPGLFGFEISGWDITEDQYAWIAGQLFGVDSGRTWPLEGENEETEAPVVNVDTSKLLGTWLQRDSDWEDTYIFNADGTGMLISGPENPFTYSISGDKLTLDYGEDDREEFTISVSGDLLTMIDKWDEELLLDKQKEDPDAENDQTEATETAEPTLQELIIGTWEDQETEYKETFTFNADGTGKYSFEEDGHWEYTFTYEWYDGDYVEFTYDDDGSVSGFTVRIEDDVMYVSNTAVADMPLVRK